MEAQLKQRVVGASVLVVLGIIVLPMILSGPPEPDEVGEAVPVAVNPGTRDDGFSSRIVPQASPAPPTPSRGEGEPRARNAPTSASALEARPTGGGSARTSPPVPPPPVSSQAPAGRAAKAQGWAVQLGAFAKASNALALRDRLKAKGYRAFVEAVVQDGRKVTRVLVGPSRDHARAEAQLQALRRATNLGGFLVRYPP